LSTVYFAMCRCSVNIEGKAYIPNNSSLMYPLAVAWKVNTSEKLYYRKDLLARIESAINALLPNIDNDGRINLVGTDGKIWQKHYDPWLYLHMIRTYNLVKGEIDQNLEAKWRSVLEKGFTGIAYRELPIAPPHNLPLVQAVALSIASKTFDKPMWGTIANAFIRSVISRQSEDGYWSEHLGPVVDYNFVYMNALGIYFAESLDEAARVALEKGAQFHYKMRYLDGTNIETVDERNFYRKDIREGNTGFAFSTGGSMFINEQYEKKKYLWYYVNADFLNYWPLVEKTLLVEKSLRKKSSFVSLDNKSAVRYDGRWQYAVSAHVAEQSKNRWLSDRQNFISVYHEKTGLIVGGGNTKLQALWSTFTVGDTNLLKYSNVENPDFSNPAGLDHIPDRAELIIGDVVGLHLWYGAEQCTVQPRLVDDNSLWLEYKRLTLTPKKVEAHVTIIPNIAKQLLSQNRGMLQLTDKPFALEAGTFGEYFEHNGVRFYVSPFASVRWPVYPYDQYMKDGKAALKDARIVITLPLSAQENLQLVRVEVLDLSKGILAK
jgi:hypothetical protein